jgi:hypothetical protein
MSKASKPTAATTLDVVDLTPTPTPLKQKPATVQFTDSGYRAMHKLTALVREGYRVTNIEAFGVTWMMTITLELGDPDPAIVMEASDDMQHAIDLEQVARRKEIEQAAEQLVADRERAARQAALAAEIHAQEQALAALKAAAHA